MWRWCLGLSALCSIPVVYAVVILPDIVVTSAKPSANSDVSVSTEVSDNDTDAAESISHLLGVVVTQMTGSGSDASVSVRGFGGDASGNSVLVVNGMSQVNASQTTMVPNRMSPFNVKSIELLEQSDSVLYGNHAVGGIVKVNTIPVSEQCNGLSMGLGSYDTYRWDAQLKTDHGPWSIVTLIQTVHSDNYRDHNAWDNADMRTTLAYDTDYSHWEWMVNAGDESLQLPGALSEEQLNEDRQQADSSINNMNRHPIGSSLTGESSISDDWLLRTQLQWSDVEEDGYQGSTYTSDGDVFQWRETLESRYPVWMGSAWLGGLELLTSEYQYDMTGYNPNSDEDMLAVFAQSSTPIKDKTTLIIGGRAAWNQLNAAQSEQQWSSNDAVTASTIALHYAVSDQNYISLRRATSFRFPTTDESAWTQNGEPLKTQTGTSYEIHWQDKQTDWDSDVGVYDLSLDNEILYVPYQDSLYYGYNENLPPTQRLGAHMMLRYHWSSRWEWLGRYDWANATITEGQDDGNKIPFVAENQWLVGVTYFPSLLWRVGVQYRYMGQRYAIGDIDNALKQESGYGLLNATLAYHRDDFCTSLSLKNITAVKYNMAAVESTNSDGDSSVYYYPAPRFTLMWSLVYQLD